MPEGWRKAHAALIFKRSKKEDPGNNTPVSLTLIPGKVMEQLILDTISRDMKDKKDIRTRQHEFTKGKSCLTRQWTENWLNSQALRVIDQWHSLVGGQ